MDFGQDTMLLGHVPFWTTVTGPSRPGWQKTSRRSGHRPGR